MKFYYLILCVFWVSALSFARSQDAEAIIKNSDYTVTIDCSRDPNLMDIGILDEFGKTGLIKNKYFERSDLVKYFDRQKHKALIHVEVLFLKLKGDALHEYLDSLGEYFIKRGYNRVVIMENTMTGSIILRDINVKISKFEE